MNRLLRDIGLLVGLAFAVACARLPKEGTYGFRPSPGLSSIDSLMWRQPDSAFSQLLQFANTADVDSLDAFDRNYFQLLVAELLYKNDYAQSNRPELKQAVAYYNSLNSTLADNSRPVFPHCGPDPQSPDLYGLIPFLSARTHYINGVGYYENDSAVEACAEYLKALEVMEDRFEEKELVEKRAQFMAYTYNRLADLFSEQFMMETSIICYECALDYCTIEPTSSNGISNNLYRIGRQYDKMNEIDKARQYYGQALECISGTDNLIFRDIVASKAIADYQYGIDIEQLLDHLRQIISHAENETERINRYLTIGTLFYKESIYDSALYYLIPVMEFSRNKMAQIQAATFLRHIYESSGTSEKAEYCIHFLADNKKTEGENKAVVSRLEDLFETYMRQKQETKAAEEREKSVRKVVGIIIPIAIMVTLSIIILAKTRSKKLLEKQQEIAEKLLMNSKQNHEIELRHWQAEAHKTLKETEKRHKENLVAERLSHQKEQEILRQSLQYREEQVNALERALNIQREEAELRREAFMKEPICRDINDRIRSQRITARNSHTKTVSFSTEDAVALKAAVLKHYENFESILLSKYPKMGLDDLQLCQLSLMGLDERQIAVLQNKSYSAIKKRENTLKRLLGIDENLQSFLLKMSSFQES